MSASNATLNSDDDLTSPYNYTPTQSVTLIFLVLFAISTGSLLVWPLNTTVDFTFLVIALHLGQAIRFRIWWLLPTAVLAGIGETIGWVARYWSSRNVLNNNAFLMQITTTIISPTPLLAANFIIFARLSSMLGAQYSRLSPRWYSRIFLTCDIIALVIQAAGGGIASSADSVSTQNVGSNVMLAGIVFQLVSLVFFSALMAEFFLRFWISRPLRFAASSADGSSSTLVRGRQWNLKLKLAAFGLAFSSVLLFIRGVYRTIELADGWNGRIISTQVYFNVLDGAMVVLAMYTLNFFHPGVLLSDGGSSNVSGEDKYTDSKGSGITSEMAVSDDRESS
ncbi:RTA1 like protein-domain-containing protein [Cytidiella melzeri]|nr:RTA1 like protein-domain-containing protein [Cytidiella melzeri]